MKLFRFDRSLTFLVIILIVLLVTALVMALAMRTDPVKDSLSGDNLLKVLVVLEDGGKPISTNIVAYYPGSKRAAMFDIPGETGLILKALGRVDRIDAVYAEKGVTAFKAEIEGVTGISIPFYLRVSLDQFSRLADLFGGLNVFIPTPVDIKGDGKRTLLPSGAVALDGDKLRTYVTYTDQVDQEGEASSRKQKAILAFFRALNDDSATVFAGEEYRVLTSCLESNVSGTSLRELLGELSRIDAERLVPQRVTGSVRLVDGKELLFPFEDGQLLRDVIRQTFAGLASEDSATQERIYAIEVLNGTKSQGLARTTSELYQSFGYDVIRVGNTEDSEYEKTVIIDRIGNQTVASTIAQVIKCANIETTSVDTTDTTDLGTEATVDFTIILGRDFNGRYVR